MANYLLLRDNKENGPFSLEDLVKMGLKAYDLVWVEGKSAAWRYPSEINELKAYAPEVEEQPFDRFFKKPGATLNEQHVAQTATQPVVQTVQPAQSAQSVQSIQSGSKVADEYEAYAPKVVSADQQKPAARKSVFVTMPGGYSAEKKAIAKPAPVQKPVPAAIPDYTADDAEETVSIKENPVAKIKYSQPLDEIKEMYVKTLKDRKDRIARSSFMKVGLKRVAVVAGLIGVGLLAGFILKSRSGQNSSLAQQLSSPVTSMAATAIPGNGTQPAQGQDQSVELPQETAATPLQEPVTESRAVNNEQIKIDAKTGIVTPARPRNLDVAEKRTAINTARDESKSSTKKSIVTEETRRPLAVMPPPDTKKQDATQEEYMASSTDPSTGERSRTVRMAPDPANNSPRSDKNSPVNATSSSNTTVVSEKALSGLGDKVSVNSNDYKRVALGGIRNLELTVSNRSKYDLDEVAVELQYLKPGDQVLKTQIVQFKSVAANNTETLRIPDTNRGVKVQFRIVRIGSSQLVDR